MPPRFPLFVLGFFGLIALILCFLAVTQTDRRIVTEVTINAPPDEVWRVLTNTPDYAMWNPFLLRVAGTLSQDEKLEITARPPDCSEMSFTARIRRIEPNRQLVWFGGLPVPGLFNGEHSFVLEPTPDGHTRFVQSETFTGLLIGPLSSTLLDKTEQGFRDMNQALKARCESGR